MTAEQELVYGWMGLSPALLLDPVPSSENVLVRVVRPDADPAKVVEEARQQLAASGSRRRRRGRGGDASATAAPNPSPTPVPAGRQAIPAATESPGHQDMPPILEITPAPFEAESSPAPAEMVSVALPRRRRSSGGSSEGSEPVAAPVATAEKGGVTREPEAEPEADDAGEPRRRRRRSSAPG